MKIKKLLDKILLFQIFLPLLLLKGCVFAPLGIKFDAVDYLASQNDKIGKSSQILLVKDESFLFFTSSKLYVMERQGDMWRMAFEPFHSVIGRNGFAPPGGKKEGDGKTPTGIYTLKLAFGYPESINTKMPYRQALPDDIWVDDVNADDYNRWTKRNQTRAVSFEMMKREDSLYKFGVVIEYNTDPVIKGNGSAIFLHIWKEKGALTAGCVAVSEEDILKILQWLDPAKSPVIITGI